MRVTATAPATLSSPIDHRTARRSFRPWWRWLLTALAFPPSGLIAHLVAGRVDSVSAAVLNGVIAGAGIGAAQWALLRHRGVSLTWIAATAVGLGAGLAAGAALVSYRTDITSLAVMGAVTGTRRRHRPRRDARHRQAHARLDRRQPPRCGPSAGPSPPPAASTSASNGPSSAPTGASPSPSCRAPSSERSCRPRRSTS